jgi:hypothetical protein
MHSDLTIGYALNAERLKPNASNIFLPYYSIIKELNKPDQSKL